MKSPKSVRRATIPDTRNRADEARRRLGITKEQVDEQPRITALLRDAGISKDRVAEILESDAERDSRLFVEKWRSISESDRDYLSIEEICVAATITSRRLWELIAGARLTQSQDVVKLIIADSMPKVVSNAVKAATEAVPIMDGQGQVQGWTYGDMKATDFLGKISGLIPQAKPGIQIFNNVPSLPIPNADDPDGPPLPSMDSALKEIQNVIATPQLEAPKEQIPFIPEAEYEDIEVEG